MFSGMVAGCVGGGACVPLAQELVCLWKPDVESYWALTIRVATGQTKKYPTAAGTTQSHGTGDTFRGGSAGRGSPEDPSCGEHARTPLVGKVELKLHSPT